MGSSSLLTSLLFVFCMIFLNGFFAAAELAIISLNDSKIKKMAEEGDKQAELLRKLVSEPSAFLSTIQVGITLAGFLSSAFAADRFADDLALFIKKLGVPVADSAIKAFSLVFVTLILSYFTLVLGELVPKRIAMQNKEKVSKIAVRPIIFLSRIAAPFIKLLSFSTNFVIKLFGGDPDVNEEQVTEEEIRMMVDVGEENGVILDSEKTMIDNIFEFDNTVVTEIMTHRTEIVAVPIDITFKELCNVVMNEKFSRIPVYEESIDNIVGILHVKDLMKFLAKDSFKEEDFDIRDVIRPPYFVPSSKITDQLFRELQQSKNHMAVVIDEYGGTAGIVTMEDLLEEIVGNIFDEYDDEEIEIQKVDDNTTIMDGCVSLEDVQKFLNTELPIEDYETLSGFLVGQLGRIPNEDEKPEIEYEGFLFKVEEVEEKRISKVKICRAS